MDGSAFYVEHVAQGNYVLQFGSAEIPISVSNSGAPNSPYCQGEFIHNITKQELEKHSREYGDRVVVPRRRGPLRRY